MAHGAKDLALLHLRRKIRIIMQDHLGKLVYNISKTSSLGKALYYCLGEVDET